MVRVRGSGEKAMITYTNVHGGQSSEVVSLPWSLKYRYGELAAPYVYAEVVNGKAGSKLECSLYEDGKLISSHTGSGARANVYCSREPSQLNIRMP